jgi:hypothetical protein
MEGLKKTYSGLVKGRGSKKKESNSKKNLTITL